LRLLCNFFYMFFFSSRRRHTRFSRDWSSDVCSSDLLLQGKFEVAQKMDLEEEEPVQGKFETAQRVAAEEEELLQPKSNNTGLPEIGRASCRARAAAPVVGAACPGRAPPTPCASVLGV